MMTTQEKDPERILDDRHREQLHASGIDDALIERAGIYSSEGTAVRDRLGWNPKGGTWPRGMMFPFASATGEVNGYARFKPDWPRADKDGKAVKYESPRNTPNRAYFPPSIAATIADPTASLIITEGEKKALCATSNGFAAIGLVGVWGWQCKRKRTDAGRGYGKRVLIADLDGIDWSGRTVYIIFDSDAATNDLVQQAEVKLAEALQEKGATAKVVRLPAGPGGTKVGLDDYIVANGADSLRALLEEAKPAEAPPAANALELARQFLEGQCMALGARTLQWWRDTFYIWRDRRYQAIQDSELDAVALRWLSARTPNAATPRRASEIVGCLRAECLIPFHLDAPLSLDDEHSGRDLIAMDNGILDVGALLAGKDNALRPQSPKWFSMNAVGYRFDFSADCPRFLAFLNEVLEGDPDRIALLQEWTGYNLVPDVSYHKFLILVGEGANGKSVYLDILEATIGPDNASHVPLELFGGRFQLGPTIGKLANIAAEVGDLDKQSEGLFKAFVSGDAVPIDRKNREPIHARPTARVTIATNTKPRWADRSEGIWRRQIICPFDVRIAEDKQDRTLARTIIDTELPGVFLWAIAGLHRLRQQGRFTQVSACVDAAASYREEINPARAFLQDECDPSPGSEVPSAEVYRAYAAWCKDRGYKPLHEAHFGHEIRRVYPAVQKFRRRMAGRQVTHYAGLSVSVGEVSQCP